MNDNDFRNESQRYFDEMMKLYAKSGNANSNAEGVQSGPSSALGNSIPVNNNSATQRINNAERMSDNNMSEPEINLNEVRENAAGTNGYGAAAKYDERNAAGAKRVRSSSQA